MNPFSYGTVVRGNFFYDRREEGERIVSTLSNGNNMLLSAPRRYGKTSLVFGVIEQLSTKGYTCVYFDFLPVYSIETFVSLYMQTFGLSGIRMEQPEVLYLIKQSGDVPILFYQRPVFQAIFTKLRLKA